MGYNYDKIRRERVAVRKQLALERAALVPAYLRELGVQAKLFGSINTDRFALHPDIDFLVTLCSEEERYRVESGIGNIMREIPFDVALQVKL